MSQPQVPSAFIFCCWVVLVWSSNGCSFKTYLHNDTPLTDKGLARWQVQPFGSWSQAPYLFVDQGVWRSDTNRKAPQEVIYTQGKQGKSTVTSMLMLGDCELHLEYMVGKGDHATLWLLGRYPITLTSDLGDKNRLTAMDAGGLPMLEVEGDSAEVGGVPPKAIRLNGPDDWELVDVTFQAVRYDDKGKLVAHAQLLKLVINGKTILENVVLKHQSNAPFQPESNQGPLVFTTEGAAFAVRNVYLRY